MGERDLAQIEEMIEGIVREEIKKLDLIGFLKKEVGEIKIRTSEENLKRLIT